MPPVLLTDVEARILGSLVEKSYTTPGQYPLTLNALTSACNQKTSRDPVMHLEEAAIARALAGLQEKNLVGRRSEPGSRVTKFMHHVENLIGGGTAQETGAICVLLLRGPQTPGEIKTRTDRICDFASTAEVESVLLELAGRPGHPSGAGAAPTLASREQSGRTDGPLVARLSRQPGQKEARYRHLFCGPAPETKPAPIPPRPAALTLERRVERLETAIKELQERLAKAAPAS